MSTGISKIKDNCVYHLKHWQYLFAHLCVRSLFDCLAGGPLLSKHSLLKVGPIDYRKGETRRMGTLRMR
jgi:hypothetical protein